MARVFRDSPVEAVEGRSCTNRGLRLPCRRRRRTTRWGSMVGLFPKTRQTTLLLLSLLPAASLAMLRVIVAVVVVVCRAAASQGDVAAGRCLASAMHRWQAGDRVAALRAFDDVVATYPMFIDGYLNAAAAWDAVGDRSQARSILLQGLFVA